MKPAGKAPGGDKPQRELPADDARLFREAVRGAKPLRAAPRVQHADKPVPVPVQSLLDSHRVLVESHSSPLSPEQALETGEELAYLRSGLPVQVLQPGWRSY